MKQPQTIDELVSGIPLRGAIVIVPNSQIQRDVIELIRSMRGAELERKCRVAIVMTRRDMDRLYGFEAPVRIYPGWALWVPRGEGAVILAVDRFRAVMARFEPEESDG